MLCIFLFLYFYSAFVLGLYHLNYICPDSIFVFVLIPLPLLDDFIYIYRD